MAKRSKLLKNAASCKRRGPPEDSLGARTIAVPVSLIRQPPFISREEVMPHGQAPAFILERGHTSASYPHTEIRKH